MFMMMLSEGREPEAVPCASALERFSSSLSTPRSSSMARSSCSSGALKSASGLVLFMLVLPCGPYGSSACAQAVHEILTGIVGMPDPDRVILPQFSELAHKQGAVAGGQLGVCLSGLLYLAHLTGPELGELAQCHPRQRHRRLQRDRRAHDFLRKAHAPVVPGNCFPGRRAGATTILQKYALWHDQVDGSSRSRRDDPQGDAHGRPVTETMLGHLHTGDCLRHWQLQVEGTLAG